MSENNKIILFTAKYELPDWKKALGKYGYDILHFEGILSDVALNRTVDGTPHLYINGPAEGIWDPLGGIWRIGAIKPRWEFELFLEVLDAAQDLFPMINPANAHLICAQRIRMLSALNSIKNFPVVPFHAFVTGRYLIESRYKPKFPVVVKIGNYQQGLMKWKIENEDQWHDVYGAMRSLEMPVIIEDFIEFDTDYRVIFIGDDMHLIKRDFEGWKANRARSLEVVHQIPEEVIELVHKTREATELIVGALDFVEGKNGYTIFEVGDAPDLDPDFVQIDDPWNKVAALLHDKIKN